MYVMLHYVLPVYFRVVCVPVVSVTLPFVPGFDHANYDI